MSSETTIGRDFDYSALSEPVTNPATRSLIWQRIGLVCFIVFVFAVVVGIEFGFHKISLVASLNFIAGAFILFGAIFTFATYAELQEIKERLRLKLFAAANNLIFYIEQPSGEKQTGAIFTVEDAHNQQFEVVRAPGDPFYEFGNYRYVTGSGKNQSSCGFGFVHFKLTRHLPNLLLCSREDNHLTKKLPIWPDPSQRLTLEGNFNDYFSLYVPKSYEEDALTIFTPDVMQTMIKAVHAYTCEVVDDDFYIYTDQFKSKVPGHLQEVLTMLTVLMPMFKRQTQNYRDDTVGLAAANSVAEPGKHLRGRTPILYYAMLVMVFGYLLFMVIIFTVES